MDKEKLRALQLVQLSIMEDIHRVCVKHHLRYYLIGGSALGAVRHKGFIPWDVDIDIAMPRPDYEAFVDVYSTDLASKLECVSYKTRKKYAPPHAIVLLKNSRIIDRSGQRQTDLRPSEIFVDILPLDVCPEEEKDQRRQAVVLNRIKKIKYRKAGWIFPGDGLIKRLSKKAISGMFLPFSWYYLNDWQQRVMTEYNSTSRSGMWCSMVSHYGYKKLMMPMEVFGLPTLVKFEHTSLYVPEKVEEYLTRLFGDFMRLPSIETQKQQRDCFVDATW